MNVGLPRSGKSTFWRGKGIPVVCPDEIRKALGCFPFVASMEPEVWKIARLMVQCLFVSGASTVVLDACNVTKKRRDEWKSDAYRRMFYIFTTPMQICIDRAETCGQEYLIPVIERMQKEFSIAEFNEPDFHEPFVLV